MCAACKRGCTRESLRGAFVSLVNPKLNRLNHPGTLAICIIFANLVAFASLVVFYANDCQKYSLGYVNFDDFDARGHYFTNHDRMYPTVFVDKIAVWNHEGTGLTQIYTAAGGVDPKSSFHGVVVDGEWRTGEDTDTHLGCLAKWNKVNAAFMPFQADYANFLLYHLHNEQTGDDLGRATVMQRALAQDILFPAWTNPAFRDVIKQKFECTEPKEQPMKALSVDDFLKIWEINYKIGVMVNVNIRASMECFANSTWSSCLQIDGNSQNGFTTESARGHGPVSGLGIANSIASLSSVAATYMTIDYRVCPSLASMIAQTLAVLVYVETLFTILLIAMYLVAGGQLSGSDTKLTGTEVLQVGMKVANKP